MYDCIVLGTGGVGSAALWHLAERGLKVLGIDRFPAGHDRGSSHGMTRVIRQVYFEHSDYVPLLQRAYGLWAQVCDQSQANLWTQPGLVQIGPPQGEVITGVLSSAQDHKLPIELLSREEHALRFPHLGLPDDMVSVFEPTGGVLHVEACVRAFLSQATAQNAELIYGPNILALERSEGHWRVRTDQGDFRSAQVIVTAGTWTADILPRLASSLNVLRKVLVWYDVGGSVRPECDPVFLYEVPEGVFYGFPEDSVGQLKVARHTGGLAVEAPLQLDRDLHPYDHEQVDQLVDTWLQRVTQPQPVQHAVCMYTMSPDLHFLVGCLEPGLAVAAGLSGHGYKFAPVLGEALADLAMHGGTDLPIEFLCPSRLFG